LWPEAAGRMGGKNSGRPCHASKHRCCKLRQQQACEEGKQSASGQGPLLPLLTPQDVTATSHIHTEPEPQMCQPRPPTVHLTQRGLGETGSLPAGRCRLGGRRAQRRRWLPSRRHPAPPPTACRVPCPAWRQPPCSQPAP
jgi:hypothetical protein